MDFIVKAFDPTDLEEEITIAEQFGGSGDDVVTAITANEETTDIVIVGYTSSESDDDHLFDLTTSEFSAKQFFVLVAPALMLLLPRVG